MMNEPLFLSSIAAIAAIMIARSIGGAIRGREASRSEIAQLREQLDQHAAALEDVETSLSHLSPQVSELQERLDFAERVLLQGRDRDGLGPADVGETGGPKSN
jgi:uncharacterized protein involved in exopolysaccharide biosynthesis